MFFAETTIAAESWGLTLANYGVAGIMLGFFMWRDRKTEEARTIERNENAKIQRDNTNALNLLARSLMVEVIALKHGDETVKELATKIKEDADAAIAANGK